MNPKQQVKKQVYQGKSNLILLNEDSMEQNQIQNSVNWLKQGQHSILELSEEIQKITAKEEKELENQGYNLYYGYNQKKIQDKVRNPNKYHQNQINKYIKKKVKVFLKEKDEEKYEEKQDECLNNSRIIIPCTYCKKNDKRDFQLKEGHIQILFQSDKHKYLVCYSHMKDRGSIRHNLGTASLRIDKVLYDFYLVNYCYYCGKQYKDHHHLIDCNERIMIEL